MKHTALFYFASVIFMVSLVFAMLAIFLYCYEAIHALLAYPTIIFFIVNTIFSAIVIAREENR